MKPEHGQLRDYVEKAFGGATEVKLMRHEGLEQSVTLLLRHEAPDGGISSVSTIGLSEVAMRGEDGEEFPVRLELCAAFPTEAAEFPWVVATIALIVKKTEQLLTPGSLVEDAVREAVPGTTVPHAYLTEPFAWGEHELDGITVKGRETAWLMVVPITESERAFLELHGDEAFEAKLEDAEADIYDLEREGVV